MKIESRIKRLPYRQLGIAALAFVVTTILAFTASELTENREMFSFLTPVDPGPELDGSRQPELHMTFFTAWASMIMVIPALCAFWFRRQSETAKRWWISFWTAGFVSFFIHFYYSVVFVFEGDFGTAMISPDVVAPLLSTIAFVWWGVDVFLSWAVRHDLAWVNIERTLIHLLVFALFFVNTVIMGDVTFSVVLGILMTILVLGSFVYWLVNRERDQHEGAVNKQRFGEA